MLNAGQDFQFLSPVKRGVQKYETVPVHLHKLLHLLKESRFLQATWDIFRVYQQEGSAWAGIYEVRF